MKKKLIKPFFALLIIAIVAINFSISTTPVYANFDSSWECPSCDAICTYCNGTEWQAKIYCSHVVVGSGCNSCPCTYGWC